LFNPSKAPVVEKAQHDPQFPWFLIPVTTPAETQSTSPTEICFSSVISSSAETCLLGISNPRTSS